MNVLQLNLALDDMSTTRIVPSSPVQTDLIPTDVFGAADPGLDCPGPLHWCLCRDGRPAGTVHGEGSQRGTHLLSRLPRLSNSRLLSWSQVKADDEMDWKTFAIAMMVFSLVGIVFLFLLQLAQPVLPLNPAGAGSPSWDLALNTAVSFVTNTNWQAYAGETGVSYLTQMIGLCVQNFTSAATGLAVLVGLAYGLSRRSASTIGNFWVLLVRSVMILLPLSIIIALILVSQGTVQTLAGPVTVPLLDPVKDASGCSGHHPDDPARARCIPDRDQTARRKRGRVLQHELGPPVRESHAVCQLHRDHCNPPDPGSALLFLREDGRGREERCQSPDRHDPHLPAAPWPCHLGGTRGQSRICRHGNRPDHDRSPAGRQHGRQGSAVRHHVLRPLLRGYHICFLRCGQFDARLFTPLGGFVQLLMMQFGEVVYGGIGSGLYGMLVFVIIAMFIAGLMVGRTPEYLGKKIEPQEMTIATIIILIPIFLILISTAVAVLVDPGKTAVLNPGPHGFSEILYAFTSASQNNGSAFARAVGQQLVL